MSEQITCAKHGQSRYSVICQHLASGIGLGYIALPETPDFPAQAWCVACDDVLDEHQGWSDAADARAGWLLFCRHCFLQTLQLHTLVATAPEIRSAGP